MPINIPTPYFRKKLCTFGQEIFLYYTPYASAEKNAPPVKVSPPQSMIKLTGTSTSAFRAWWSSYEMALSAIRHEEIVGIKCNCVGNFDLINETRGAVAL